MRLSPTAKVAAVAGATMLGTYVVTKRGMVARCRKVIVRECGDAVVFTDAFCRARAREICEG